MSINYHGDHVKHVKKLIFVWSNTSHCKNKNISNHVYTNTLSKMFCNKNLIHIQHCLHFWTNLKPHLDYIIDWLVEHAILLGHSLLWVPNSFLKWSNSATFGCSSKSINHALFEALELRKVCFIASISLAQIWIASSLENQVCVTYTHVNV